MNRIDCMLQYLLCFVIPLTEQLIIIQRASTFPLERKWVIALTILL